MKEDYYKKIEKLKLMTDFGGFPYEKKSNNINRKRAKIKKHILWKLTTRYNKYSGTQLNRSAHEWKEDLYFHSIKIPRIAIYTCITKGYDTPKEPFFSASNIDYFIFSDTNEELKSRNWRNININDLETEALLELDSVQKNRFIKMHPQTFFEKYDYSLYIDGNVTIISNIAPLIKSINEDIGISLHKHNNRDCIFNEAKVLKILGKGDKSKINKQINKYSKEGFPKHYGLLEATIIFTDLRNPKSKVILENWWEEFLKSESYRDQLSLPYILWQQGISTSKADSLGNNLYRSSKFFVEHHS